MSNFTTTQGQDTGSNQVLTANSWSRWSTTTTTPSPSEWGGAEWTVGTSVPSGRGLGWGNDSTTSADVINTNQPATSGGDTNLPTNKQQTPQQAESTHTGTSVQKTALDESTSGGAVLMIVGELIAALVIITVCYFLYSRRVSWYEKWRKDHPAPPCKTCGGTGSIQETVTTSAPCNHCKQTWRDICHHCGGSGKTSLGITVPQTEEEVASLLDCDYCSGKGFSEPAIPCCMCKGERKITSQKTITVPCPACHQK